MCRKLFEFLKLIVLLISAIEEAYAQQIGGLCLALLIIVASLRSSGRSFYRITAAIVAAMTGSWTATTLVDQICQKYYGVIWGPLKVWDVRLWLAGIFGAILLGFLAWRVSDPTSEVKRAKIKEVGPSQPPK